MQRVAIVGQGPAALSTAERLIGAGMCVDLISSCTAPFGLLRRFAGTCPTGSIPRLRLIGNVKVGTRPEDDISPADLHRLTSHPDRFLLLLELEARNVAFTTWEGLCHPITELTDWQALNKRAQLAPVCF